VKPLVPIESAGEDGRMHERHLTTCQREAIFKGLSGRGSFKATVVCMKDTPETWVYADEFVEVLKESNWEAMGECSEVGDVGVWVGVSDLSRPAGADFLFKALQDAGVDLTYDHVTTIPKGNVDGCWLEVGYERHSLRLSARP